jgi:hypothetical protein
MFAAELAAIRRKNTERAITGPQTYLRRSLLDFMTAPCGPSSTIGPNLSEICCTAGPDIRAIRPSWASAEPMSPGQPLSGEHQFQS